MDEVMNITVAYIRGEVSVEDYRMTLAYHISNLSNEDIWTVALLIDTHLTMRGE